MGRYLTAEIITDITVKSHYDRKEKQSKEKILTELNKMINLDFFNIDIKDQKMKFYLKEEVLNKYLKDYLKELEELKKDIIYDYFIHDLFGEQGKNKKINDIKENFKFKIKEEYNGRKHKVLIYDDNEENAILLGSGFFSPDEYYFIKDDNIREHINIKISGFTIIIDFNKYDGEDETFMCDLLNLLIRKGMNNPLKDITYFLVDG